MRSALAVLILLACTAPAFAAEEGHAAAKEEGAKAEGGKPGTNVDMPFLMAPMTGADGKLSGYAYIATRVTAVSESFAIGIRDKLAFIQDAFVRDVNGAGVSKADDPAAVDQVALIARLTNDAKKVMGPGKVASVSIVQIQVAPLHPTQTPALHTPPPPPLTPLGGGCSCPPPPACLTGGTNLRFKEFEMPTGAAKGCCC